MTAHERHPTRTLPLTLACFGWPEELRRWWSGRLIARLRQRVRRKGKKSTQIVYLISSLSLAELQALGWLKLKRNYWVIESRLHHPVDVSLGEDRSRVRHPNAALVLGMFRRVMVSCALAWLAAMQTTKTRYSMGFS
jgi:hypothetical protein